MTTFDLDLSKYQLGWNDEVEYAFDPVKGLHLRLNRGDCGKEFVGFLNGHIEDIGNRFSLIENFQRLP
ncbi:MAG: hypothetical protein VW552_07235, partial [Ilumatobacter sp.]